MDNLSTPLSDVSPLNAGLFGLEDDGEDELVDPELILQQILEDPGLTQYITRNEVEGVVAITAYYRVRFQSGQSRQVLHVPFSPPLQVVPIVEVQAVEQEGVRVRITDCQKFGLRAEIIWAPQDATIHQSPERDCLVEVIATCT
jgi:hypothetical protein